jgi:hypothetical protein
MAIKCKESFWDLYYSNRGVIPAVFKTCELVNGMNPATHVKYIIDSIKNDLDKAFNTRYGLLNTLKTTIQLKIPTINKDKYDSFYEELGNTLEEHINFENIQTDFNKSVEQLNELTETYINALNAVAEEVVQPETDSLPEEVAQQETDSQKQLGGKRKTNKIKGKMSRKKSNQSRRRKKYTKKRGIRSSTINKMAKR